MAKTTTFGFTEPATSTNKTAPTMYKLDLLGAYDDPQVISGRSAAYYNSEAGAVNGMKVMYFHNTKQVQPDADMTMESPNKKPYGASSGVKVQAIASTVDGTLLKQTDAPCSVKITFETPDVMLDELSNSMLLEMLSMAISALQDEGGNWLVRKLATGSCQRFTNV